MAIQDTLMNLPESAFQGPLEKYKKEYKDARKAILTGDLGQQKKIQNLKSDVDKLSDWYDKKLKPVIDNLNTFMKYKVAAMMIGKTLEKVNNILAATPAGVVPNPMAPALKAIQYAQKAIVAAAKYVTKYLVKILDWANQWRKWAVRELKVFLDNIEWLINKTTGMQERRKARENKMEASVLTLANEEPVVVETVEEEEVIDEVVEVEETVEIDEAEVEVDNDESDDESDDSEYDGDGG